MTDRITITSGALTATIDPLGAELVSLTDADGRELMTNADPAFWSSHAPLLFPIVGRLNGDELRIDGHAHPMKQHGFARRMVFALSERRDDRVTFRLEADPETRRHYPFEFELLVTFALAGATLDIDVAIVNGDAERAMPASFGFHPAFAWPLPYGRDRADHRITFAADEPDAIRTLSGGLIAGHRPSPLEDRVLPLADDLFAHDALIWDHVRSTRVTYGASDGPQLEIAFPDTPMLGIWTLPGARFVCVEPWHGIADPVGFTGDYRDKPGVFEIAPGASKRIAMAVTLRP